MVIKLFLLFIVLSINLYSGDRNHQIINENQYSFIVGKVVKLSKRFAYLKVEEVLLGENIDNIIKIEIGKDTLKNLMNKRVLVSVDKKNIFSFFTKKYKIAWGIFECKKNSDKYYVDNIFKNNDIILENITLSLVINNRSLKNINFIYKHNEKEIYILYEKKQLKIFPEVDSKIETIKDFEIDKRVINYYINKK